MSNSFLCFSTSLRSTFPRLISNPSLMTAVSGWYRSLLLALPEELSASLVRDDSLSLKEGSLSSCRSKVYSDLQPKSTEALVSSGTEVAGLGLDCTFVVWVPLCRVLTTTLGVLVLPLKASTLTYKRLFLVFSTLLVFRSS